MTPCIECSKRRTKKGYGKVNRVTPHGKFWYAHRFAWYQANGPIPDGMCVLHLCDNPPCINARHLFLGTQADNMADRDKKGRNPQGETHGRSRLTAEDVREIRLKQSNGTPSTRLAEEYGVAQSQISRIVQRQHWKHI